MSDQTQQNRSTSSRAAAHQVGKNGRAFPAVQSPAQFFLGPDGQEAVEQIGVYYHTDGHDRVSLVKGTIQVDAAESGRGTAQGQTTAHLNALHNSLFHTNTKFNGGHILAHHYGGSAGMANMVPFEKDYNQTGDYKTFENSVDNAVGTAGLAGATSLEIEIRVRYPADTREAVFDPLVTDWNELKDDIIDDQDVVDTIMVAFRRVPNEVRLLSLTDNLGTQYRGHVTQPTDPRAPLGGKIRTRNNVRSLLGKDDEVRTHKYGTGQGLDAEAEGSDYHADMKERYKNMPKPGVLNFMNGAHGLAGGMFAYVWMDPLGTQNKFGGTDTVADQGVIPKGSDYMLLRRARLSDTNDTKLYARGHLLNDGLHGPGHDSRNLVPITRSTNGLMATRFETPVKRSAALTDPDKGVYILVRTQGTVTRGAWDETAAGNVGSDALWREEAKLPDKIVMDAFEGAIGPDGAPFMTNVRVHQQEVIPNRLKPGDAHLGPTVLPHGGGNAANSPLAIANRNNTDGYDTVSHAKRFEPFLRSFGNAILEKPTDANHAGKFLNTHHDMQMIHMITEYLEGRSIYPNLPQLPHPLGIKDKLLFILLTSRRPGLSGKDLAGMKPEQGPPDVF